MVYLGVPLAVFSIKFSEIKTTYFAGKPARLRSFDLLNFGISQALFAGAMPDESQEKLSFDPTKPQELVWT